MHDMKVNLKNLCNIYTKEYKKHILLCLSYEE